MLIVASTGAKLTELFHGKLTHFVSRAVAPHLNGAIILISKTIGGLGFPLRLHGASGGKAGAFGLEHIFKILPLCNQLQDRGHSTEKTSSHER